MAAAGEIQPHKSRPPNCLFQKRSLEYSPAKAESLHRKRNCFIQMKYDLEPYCTGLGEQQPNGLRNLKDELLKGINMIATVDDQSFRLVANGTGSVGGQFRHNLDFVNSLLNGIEYGCIDYNKRERDLRVEENREFAVGRFREAIDRLSGVSQRQLSKSVLVRSELDQATWLPSSFAREAEFVHSHTVHHHALIREKLAGFGITVTETFGVAPSTLEYWEKKAA